MSDDVSKYLALVTSEHQTSNFLAVVSALVQGSVDNQALLADLPEDFDVDTAAGAQLDVVGKWVGITRNLTVPLTGVYFAWGTSGVGWGQGTWKGEFDPSTGLVVLPDDSYRTLLKFKIAANSWDGTVPSAYEIFAALFPTGDPSVIIQDNGDMTMIMALLGTIPNAVTAALFNDGELALKPAGVMLIPYTPSMDNTPYFGWGVESASISGWGVGAWGQKGTSF